MLVLERVAACFFSKNSFDACGYFFTIRSGQKQIAHRMVIETVVEAKAIVKTKVIVVTITLK